MKQLSRWPKRRVQETLGGNEGKVRGMYEKTRNKLKEVRIEVDSTIERFMENKALYLKFLLWFKEDDNFEKLFQWVSSGDCQNVFLGSPYLKRGVREFVREKMEKI